MSEKLKKFLPDNPIYQWVLALPVGAVLTQLFRLVSGESLAVTAREERALVIVAAVLLLAGGAVSVLAKLDVRRRKRLWRIVSLGVTTLAFILYTVASALAKPPPTVDDIDTAMDAGTGTAKVTVAAHDLRGGQRLVVRASWAGGTYSKTSGHKGGDARQVFTAGPAVTSGPLRAVAYVRGADDDPPKGLTCEEYDACVDLDTQLRAAPPPDLRTSVQRRALTISIPQNEKAPERAVVIVFRRGQEIFKDNPLVTTREYRRVIGLRPRAPRGTDQICVIATFQVERVNGCAASPAVSRNVFEAPR